MVWGDQEELLAKLVEVVDYGNRLFFRVHSDKRDEQPKPIRISRPGQPKAERGALAVSDAQSRRLTRDEVAQLFDIAKEPDGG